ncbi:hypothetical protein PR202_gb29155 [Eleusine coracana subsp. coracana]|uniref:Secreted protein n=1 Tax=Eleusine coracana subsp. coracana TaxID=191504 RepID=A0AAV5FZA7_ELECO|nr:hypothetical protein PR202_gb29155 [Eleusine coracana subsp. coracana]
MPSLLAGSCSLPWILRWTFLIFLARRWIWTAKNRPSISRSLTTISDRSSSSSERWSHFLLRDPRGRQEEQIGIRRMETRSDREITWIRKSSEEGNKGGSALCPTRTCAAAAAVSSWSYVSWDLVSSRRVVSPASPPFSCGRSWRTPPLTHPYPFAFVRGVEIRIEE